MYKYIFLIFFYFLTFRSYTQTAFLEHSKYTNRALVYENNNLLDSAVFYFNKAELFVRSEFAYTFCLNMAWYYEKYENLDLWKKYILKAIKNGLRKDNLIYWLNNNSNNIDSVYRKTIIDLFPELHVQSLLSINLEAAMDLARIQAVDQFFRTDSLLKTIDFNIRKLETIDSINIRRLDEYLTTHEFPSIVNVGHKGLLNFQILVLHLIMFNEFEQKWGVVLYEAVQNGLFPNNFYALAIDRKQRWKLQEKEIYGYFMFDYDNKKNAPFDDITKVDSLRQAIGLPTLYEDFLRDKITELPEGYVPDTALVKSYEFLKIK